MRTARLFRAIAKILVHWPLILTIACCGNAFAQNFERKDVSFMSDGIKCAAWYYAPKNLQPGQKRPAIVMAHGWSGVKEMFLDNFARKFAEAGFVVFVFDYRHFGGSEGEPRGQLFWYEQLEDYRNAITWVSMQSEVDPGKIGVWGTSYSGGHVLHLAAFDRRIKAVVSQVPATRIWDTYWQSMPKEARAATIDWLAQDRANRYKTGQVNYVPVVAPEGQPSTLPWKEAHEWIEQTVGNRAPNWRNKITVESLEKNVFYDPTDYIHLISPTPLLMVIASDDIVCPTSLEEAAFERAGEPKSLVVVNGRHFDAYDGQKHREFVDPQVAWFQRWLGKP